MIDTSFLDKLLESKKEGVESVTGKQFFEEYFEKKPFLVHRGDPTFYDNVFTFEHLELAIDRVRKPESKYGELILFKKLKQQSDYRSAFEAYMDGCSVVINHLDKISRSVYEFCRDLMRCMPHVYANMYLTPMGAQTVPPHSDDRDVFLLQVWGRKQWKVYPSPVVFPYSDEQLGKGDHEVPTETLQDSQLIVNETLEQGDIMYMPRGYVHQANTHPDSPSLHITIAVPTHDFTWGRILQDAVTELAKLPELRPSVPLYTLHMKQDTTDFEEFGNMFKEKLKVIIDNITPEGAQQAFHKKILGHNQKQTDNLQIFAKDDSTPLSIKSKVIKQPGIEFFVTDDAGEVPPGYEGVTFCKRPDLRARLKVPVRFSSALRTLMSGSPVILGQLDCPDDFSRLCLTIVCARLGVVHVMQLDSTNEKIEPLMPKESQTISQAPRVNLPMDNSTNAANEKSSSKKGGNAKKGKGKKKRGK